MNFMLSWPLLVCFICQIAQLSPSGVLEWKFLLVMANFPKTCSLKWVTSGSANIHSTLVSFTERNQSSSPYSKEILIEFRNLLAEFVKCKTLG